MKYLIILFLFTSCMTMKKAEQKLSSDNTEAARYCSEKFPVVEKEEKKTVAIDSSHFVEAYDALAHVADSLFYKLDSLTHAATPEAPYRPNVDSIKTVVKTIIREKLQPCKDSIVTITKVTPDRARESYLQGLSDTKDGTINKLQADNLELLAKAKWKLYFWILVSAIVLFFAAQMKFKFL